MPETGAGSIIAVQWHALSAQFDSYSTGTCIDYILYSVYPRNNPTAQAFTEDKEKCEKNKKCEKKQKKAKSPTILG